MIYFCKNHSEFGKCSVLAMCRVNDMANKIKLDPKSVVRKSVTATLTYSLSVVDFDVELIHPSMFLVLAGAGKFPLLCDVLIFIYNFGETFLQPCKNGT